MQAAVAFKKKKQAGKIVKNSAFFLLWRATLSQDDSINTEKIPDCNTVIDRMNAELLKALLRCTGALTEILLCKDRHGPANRMLFLIL